jgi:signal transduction histidine kinase
VRVIDHRDGLAGLEGCQGAALRARDGRLWFGTVRGASGIDPRRDRPDATPPRVALDGMGLYDGTLRAPAALAGERFPHDRNYFRFSFAGIQIRAPEKVRFRYRMSAIDRDWVESDLGRVQYTALPPGTYEFAVTAGNEWGAWSEPETVRFSIAPPFWRTWWFLLLMVLVVGGGVAAIVTFRVRQLLALERLRSRIAADLHDDIGSGLTEIAMLGETVRSRLGGESAPAELGALTHTARRLTTSMSDIVWLVNPRTDSLPDLVRRLVDTYRPLFQGAGMEFRVEGLDTVADLRLSMEARQNLLLAAKEMLHNALRHAEAGTVVLRVGRTPGGRELAVEDNGRGFDRSVPSSGNGLVNLERRARAVGGRLDLASSPRGTRMRIVW